MPLTAASVNEIFAPLATADPMPFFAGSLSPSVVWTYGAPGATHILAGKYNGMQEFAAAWGQIQGCIDGQLKWTVESVVADGDRAAVELHATGASKSGTKIDERAVWLVKADSNNVLVEITSYCDSASLEKLIADNKAFLA